ncbi:pumilio homolog 3 [Bacillus rossius redtenbacheri]|uniref:pumilio homolog 3 n=1 Tax=Bacillus rossius redtenbacheri TaxID=93214 RepID=UPI002FDE82D4
MTDDTALPIKQKKRSQKSSSPDEPNSKKTKAQSDPPQDKLSMVKRNKQQVRERKGQGKTVLKSGSARKKFEKATDTKQISGSVKWKEVKQKKRDLRLQRKKTSRGTTFDDMTSAKKMWEKVRVTSCPAELRERLIGEIHEILAPNLETVMFTHDGARVVQWLLKMGSPPLRVAICDRLEPLLPTMVQSKYASFCVRRMLKYGSRESQAKVIRSFSGRVVKFMRHSVTAPVLELAYSQFATSAQKAAMRQEFYGGVSRVATPGEIHCLADVYKHTPELKHSTLAATRTNILRVLSKKLTRSSLLHAVVLDFLQLCPDDEKREMLTQLRPFLLDLLVSKEGSRIAMMCVWHGSVKDRKAVIKLLKGKMKEVATSEHGHWLLLAVFDCVDDTVLLKKILVPEIINDLIEIASNEYGRLVILYLVGHRDPLYFHPAVVKVLQDGDANEVSKKDPAQRRAELLGAMYGSLLEAIAAEPHVWLASSSIAMVTLAALKYGYGKPLTLAVEALVEYLSDPSHMLSFGDKQCHAIEHSAVHLLLKKLIESDKDKDPLECFSYIFVSVVKPSTIEWWIDYNRGCFILVALLEKGSQDVKNKLINKFTENILEKLKLMKSVGAKILLKKLFE